MSQRRSRRLRFGYWASTLTLLGVESWLALQFWLQTPLVADAIGALGYPPYFMRLLGFAHLLGVAVLAGGASRALKEWAYAGLTFEACGAFASQLSAGDSLALSLLPVAQLLVILASYSFWKQLRHERLLRRRRYALAPRGRTPAHSHA
jgi:hypothetical protein